MALLKYFVKLSLPYDATKSDPKVKTILHEHAPPALSHSKTEAVKDS